MKSLNIKSDNCLLRASHYGDVEINNQDIQNLIYKNLPEGLEDYKNYPIKLNISIEFLGDDPLSIKTDGYTVKEEQDKQEEDTPTEDDSSIG